MQPWNGLRRLTIVTACLNAASIADFTLTQVEVTHDEYANGVHCDRVEALLVQEGYEEPFLHFDVADVPAFLVPAVQRYFGAPLCATTSIPREQEPCGRSK